MSIQYTRTETLLKCCRALYNPSYFYRARCLNWSGVTKKNDKGVQEYYTEIISEFILNNIEIFKNGIRTVPSGDYFAPSHNAVRNAQDPKTADVLGQQLYNLDEEIIAKGLLKLYNKTPLPIIGKLVDYQVPLYPRKTAAPQNGGKRAEDDGKEGKIDLLADDGKQLIILELKKPSSSETMLRCVMECYTYLKTVDKKQLLSDFKKPSDYGLTAAPLVFKDEFQHSEMKDIKNRPMLDTLMKVLNISPYYIYYDPAAKDFSIT